MEEDKIDKAPVDKNKPDLTKIRHLEVIIFVRYKGKFDKNSLNLLDIDIHKK